VASTSRYEVKLGEVRFSKPKQRERHAKSHPSRVLFFFFKVTVK
jgi:hypothetical protein